MAPPEAAVTVAIALLWRHGCLLVARRPFHAEAGGHWEFPGGKLEAGESPQQALIRECQEELGVSVAVGELAWQAEHTGRAGSLRLLFYHARLAGDMGQEPRPLAADELAWRAPKELLALTFCPADRSLTAALARGDIGAPAADA